jgi:PAS domain S-box
VNQPGLSSTPPFAASAALPAPAIFTIDADGVIVSTSASAERFWAIAGGLTGRTFVELVRFHVTNAPEAARRALPWQLFLASALNRTVLCLAWFEGRAPAEVIVRVEEARGEHGSYFAWVDDPARHRDSSPPILVDSGLALLSDEGGLGFFDLNFKAGRFYCSPAWRRLLGYTQPEWGDNYESWLELLHPEDSAAIPRHSAARRAQTTKHFSVEVRMRHRRGHYVWVHSIGAQVFSGDGSLERVTGVQLDVTERKEAEEHFLSAEERWDRLSHVPGVAAFDLDFAAGRYWFSPAWRELIEISLDGNDALDAFAATIQPSENALTARELFQTDEAGGEEYTLSTRIRLPAGQSAPAVIRARREFSRSGALMRAVGVCCMLPAGVELVSEKSIPTGLIAEAFESIGEGVIIADQRGRVVYLNSHAQRLTGHSLTQAKSRPLTEIFLLVHRDDGTPALEAFDDALTGGVHPPLCKDHALICPASGSARSIVWSIRQVWTPEGAIAGLVLVFRDPEEMTLTPEELLKTNRLETLGVVAGGLAHDFNNLLTTILGGISQARERRDTALLADSERACLAAKALTKQLLTVAKGGSGMTVRQLLSPADILHDAVRLAHAGSNAQICIDAPDTLPPISVDRGQMLQVFQNLIINALQALPPQGGRIRLNAETIQRAETDDAALPPGDYVEISVTDNGSGIAPDAIERIFEPFFTTKKSGTGLGLPTVRNIVLRHGGEVRVFSKLGEGTRFVIQLPLAGPASTEMKARRKPSLRFGTGRILLMDDDENIRRLTGEMLTGLGYSCDTVSNGDEALAYYRRYLAIGKPYDAVILDLTVVGGIGGEDTFRELAAIDPDVVAIACTGYDSEELAAGLLEQGFRGYLSKPFRSAELGSALKKVVPSRPPTH